MLHFIRDMFLYAVIILMVCIVTIGILFIWLTTFGRYDGSFWGTLNYIWRPLRNFLYWLGKLVLSWTLSAIFKPPRTPEDAAVCRKFQIACLVMFTLLICMPLWVLIIWIVGGLVVASKDCDGLQNGIENEPGVVVLHVLGFPLFILERSISFSADFC